MSRQSWVCEQDSAITHLVQQFGLNDWSQIAASLKQHYPFSKRTGKQCRERWYNHLNPSVTKLPWTASEEHRLFQMHRNMGNRWKDISKTFPGRTDNDIKNHFYSTLRRSLRRLNKVLGQRNSTTQMREIKPSVLTTIMRQPELTFGSPEHSKMHLKDLPTLIFDFAHFKPVKKSPVPANLDDVKDRIAEIFELISQYNNEYESLKLDRSNNGSRRVKSRSVRSQIIFETIPQLQLEKHLHIVNEQPKQLPSTQIQIKEEPQNSIDYYVYNLDNQMKEDEQQNFPQERLLNKNVSHISLQAEEFALEFGDPQQPSRQSHGQNQLQAQIQQGGGWPGDAEDEESQEEGWAGSVHI